MESESNIPKRDGLWQWVLPCIGIFFLVSTIRSGRSWESAWAYGLGAVLLPAAAVIIAFILTDRFQNKTASRLFYVVVSGLVLYFLVL